MIGTIYLILAQSRVSRQELLDHMRSQFSQPDPELYWKVPVVMTLLGIALILVWVLAYLERRRTVRAQTPQPMQLFFTCAWRAGLSWLDIWNLWRLVRGLKIAQPAALLISRPMYDAAVKQFCTDADGQLAAGGVWRRFITIRSQLFDAPQSESETQPAG